MVEHLTVPPLAMRLYAALCRRLPIMGGLTRLSFNPLTRWGFRGVHGPVAARTHSGATMPVDVHDYDGRVLYLFGTNDPKVQAVTTTLLSPGDVFLDIGANHSTIGLAASRVVGDAGHVHLFEPQPHLVSRVTDAVAATGMRNVTMHSVALLDRNDTMTLSRPAHHSGMATLIDDGGHPGWQTIQVPVHDIATYAAPLVHGKPFGAKLDVEGAETFLVPWLAAEPNLKFLIFEAAHQQPLLFQQLTGVGMTLFGLKRTVLRRRVERVSSVGDMRRFHDLVALRLQGAQVAKSLSLTALRSELDAVGRQPAQGVARAGLSTPAGD